MRDRRATRSRRHLQWACPFGEAGVPVSETARRYTPLDFGRVEQYRNEVRESPHAMEQENEMSKVFVNIALSLDGYMTPEGMAIENWDNPEYKNWGAKWGALMSWIFNQEHSSSRT
jgi:hypothetical protein